MEEHELDALADKVANLIIEAKRVVVFTGAGVSTESGIPDFRSPGGIWDRFDPDDFTYQKFIGDPQSRRKHWHMLREGGLNLMEASVDELYARACDHDWAFACDGSSNTL